MLSPELIERWEHIIDDVEKTKVPVEFIKKLVVKLRGRRQHTINIKSLLNQSLDPEEIEIIVGRKLDEFGDEEVLGIEFILDIEGIATTVQPHADKILKDL